MIKYLSLLKLSWQNGLVYRASVLLWRFRVFLSSLMSLTVWSVIFSGQNSAFGYAQGEMITYIFLVSIIQNLIFATSLGGLSQTIYSGELSNLLVKPVNLFLYFATDDMADKLKNFFFGIFELIILFFIFSPQLILPSTINIFIFIFWVIMGIILKFFISLLMGAIGFWSPDSWGPRFLFFMIVDFTAGKLYPLDILPKIIQKIIYLTPLPYLSFMQTQLFLEKLSNNQIITSSFVFMFWIAALFILVKKVWKKGLRDYAAAGR